MPKKLTHDEAIKLLRKLERGWPKDLWLFAGDAALALLKKNKDGKRALAFPDSRTGSAYDPNATIANFPGIEAKGGGF